MRRIASAVSTLIAAGTLWHPPLPAASDDRSSGYADARVCATCHRKISDDYRQTGMGRSFFRPTPANTLEDYTRNNQFVHAISNTHFAMLQRDGAYYQRRWQIGLGGKEINIEELKVDYILGSGNHARSYLHRTAAGTLIELPLGWYPDRNTATGRWAMSPGSDNTHPRTRRFVAYKCMFCHNGYPRIPAGHDEPGSDPVYLGDLPEGIDCQRCHGPGAKHVQTARTTGARLEDLRANIVNPARLSPKLQMEVCFQCHLETTSGRIPATVQRFNRGPFSFVPGEPLENFAVHFDHAPGTGHDEKFEAVSSVYRLRQARCFIRSEGKLTCLTCHNPHRAPRGGEAVSQYSSVCRQCHASVGSLAAGKHPSSSDCVTCHMPKRRAEDTPGMIMTDHLIQRRPPAGDLLAEIPERPAEEYRGEVVPYYPAPLPPTGENSLYRAVAQVGLRNNLEAGLPDLASEIQKQKPREPEFYVVLGDGRRNAGNYRQAVSAYEEAIRLNAGSVRGLRALSAALEDAREPLRAVEALKQALRIAPSDPETWYRYGLLDSNAGREAEAIDKVRKAIALDPSLPEKSRRLADLLANSGQWDRAEAAVAEALRIDPYDEDAWDLAGRILSEKGETAEAMYDFERAVTLRPGSATFLYDYGLALARAQRFEEAHERAEAAIAADPKHAESHELLGGLYERRKQWADAAREYRQAIELRPQSGRAHLRLGSVLAAQGDISGAREHLRKASQGKDPAAAREATRALQQLGGR